METASLPVHPHPWKSPESGFKRTETQDVGEQETQLSSVEIGENILTLTWTDGIQHTFHYCWLRDCCHCDKCLSSSGQKLARRIIPGDENLRPSSAVLDNDGQKLLVCWKDHQEEPEAGEYSSKWLRKFAYSESVMESESNWKRQSHIPETGVVIPTVEYESLFTGEPGVWKWMEQLMVSGFCVVKNTPTAEQTVKKVANLVGPCSHTIYGETFDVKVTPRPINIAYSDSELESHMDLAYFESPPGIQMLHCIQFDDAVTGGESTLIDAHAVAEAFKERHPEHFRVLTTVPATFQKDHMEREFPLKMFYQRPHIHVNYLDEVTAVFWSPPFMGPLRVKPEFVEPYYAAYNAFRDFLQCEEMWQKYGVIFRLKPGDLMVFNNRRMLHGRKGFKSANGARHLQGCYLDVDTFLNKYRVLAAKMHPDAEQACLAAPHECRFGFSSHR